MASEREDEMRRRLKGEGHVRIEHLEAHAKQLRDQISELHTSDKAERDELNNRLKVIEDHITEQKAAQSKADEVKDSKSTLVVPPNDIPAQQPNTGTTPEPEVKKKLRWW